MQILNEVLHVFLKIFPLMIAENLPFYSTVFDLILVEDSFSGGSGARCAASLVGPLH